MNKKNIRFWIIEIIVLLLFGSIFFRLVTLHVYPKNWITNKTNKIRLYEDKPIANRGQIVDRNYELFALDSPGYTLFADNKYIDKFGDARLVASILSKELFIDENILLEMLSNTKKGYVPLLKNKPFNHPSFKKLKTNNYSSIIYTENNKEILLKGVVLENVRIRSYPKTTMLSHVLGYVNYDRIGSAGLEQRYNKFLQGKEGYRRGKKDAKRSEVYDQREIDTPPQDGSTLVLTIDQEIQDKVEDVIYRMHRKYKSKAVWAIVQNIQTGEIIAMASYPSFNPIKYNKVDAEWRRNRTISVNYDPGSTMKAALIAIAIDKDIVSKDDIFYCENGRWLHAGKYLHDTKNYKNLTVSEILKVSSNIGSAKIALKLGDRNLYEGLKNFNFGKKLEIGLPGEEKGQLNDIDQWTKISSSRIGIGQGITTTALQMISMMSCIANDGVQMKPYILKEIISSEGETLLKNYPTKIGNPISHNTSRIMKEMLVGVVEDENGTGGNARITNYKIAGKTGTAQKVKPNEEGGGYYDDKYVSSFIGFFPANNPQISILVTADDPKEKHYGGTVCGPAFREIAEHTIKYLKIPPEGKKIYITRENQ